MLTLTPTSNKTSITQSMLIFLSCNGLFNIRLQSHTSSATARLVFVQSAHHDSQVVYARLTSGMFSTDWLSSFEFLGWIKLMMFKWEEWLNAGVAKAAEQIYHLSVWLVGFWSSDQFRLRLGAGSCSDPCKHIHCACAPNWLELGGKSQYCI